MDCRREEVRAGGVRTSALLKGAACPFRASKAARKAVSDGIPFLRSPLPSSDPSKPAATPGTCSLLGPGEETPTLSGSSDVASKLIPGVLTAIVWA